MSETGKSAGNSVAVEVEMDGSQQSHTTVQDIIQIVTSTLSNDQSRIKLSNLEIAALLLLFKRKIQSILLVNKLYKNLILEIFRRDLRDTSWFQRVETVKLAHNVSEKVVIPIVIGKFKGSVLSWYYSKPEYASLTYNELKTKVISMFGCRKNRIALMRKFDNRKWKRSESFLNYYQDKVILGNKLNLPESDLISYIIDGFDNGTLQAQARMARFISLSELLDVMKNLSITERYGTKQSSATPSSVIPEASGSKKTIKCYNCHKEGHYASACQQAKKRTCFLCHEDGHMKNECPKKKPNQREPDSTTLLIEREPQVVPAYQISARFGFNEEEFSAILDTGRDFCSFWLQRRRILSYSRYWKRNIFGEM
ncbi:Zinc knuckle [Popillia japonica]|uniref:Zinc knuckle n=1 Tax=Popillia japonica TaxID=7064 RepID=A0AAW1LAZ8_POPJA